MANIIFSHALVFKINCNGEILTPGGIDNNYLRRYKDAGFDKIYLVSRSVQVDVESISGHEILQDINPFFLNKYTGGYKFLRSLSFYKDLYKLLKDDNLLIINYPSSTGLFLILFSWLFSLNYVVEVASDSDTYREKRFGLLVQILSDLIGRICVPKALGALYVAQFLRDKWHNANGIVLSNVHLDSISTPRLFKSLDKKITITTVGAISYRKGIDVIVRECSILNGLQKVELNIVGPVIDNRLKELIDSISVKNLEITCYGILSKGDIISILDRSDLYVQASRSEGLPRSVLEAMSRGVPVVSSKLPGLRGIIPDDYQFDINKTGELRDMIQSIAADPDLSNAMSELSIEVSKKFHIDITREIRESFYQTCKLYMSQR